MVDVRNRCQVSGNANDKGGNGQKLELQVACGDYAGLEILSRPALNEVIVAVSAMPGNLFDSTTSQIGGALAMPTAFGELDAKLVSVLAKIEGKSLKNEFNIVEGSCIFPFSNPSDVVTSEAGRPR